MPSVSIVTNEVSVSQPWFEGCIFVKSQSVAKLPDTPDANPPRSPNRQRTLERIMGKKGHCRAQASMRQGNHHAIWFASCDDLDLIPCSPGKSALTRAVARTNSNILGPVSSVILRFAESIEVIGSAYRRQPCPDRGEMEIPSSRIERSPPDGDRLHQTPRSTGSRNRSADTCFRFALPCSATSQR